MQQDLKDDFDARHQELLALRAKTDVQNAFDGALATLEPYLLPVLNGGIATGLAFLPPPVGIVAAAGSKIALPFLEDAVKRLIEKKLSPPAATS